MIVLYYFIVIIYSVVLLYITIYCLMQFHLLYYYGKSHPQWSRAESDTKKEEPSLPLVTIQLPIYNEQYVVERLIDSICAFDYPRELMEIQVLDDSDDETVKLVDERVAYYQAQGFQISSVRRKKRQGFKAGALRDAMPFVRGAFIAIFDADFLPESDFLRKTIPHFVRPEVGVVQTRWEHINEDYSLITRLQALQLNVHFTIEQQGRETGSYMLQFNGTAGVWRKKTIEDAGGWQDDTLTEDLDLSMRAQLKGWKIVYLEEVGSPAELPAEMNGFKSQQYRWMKGGAETARKMLPAIWKASIPLRQKLHATLHLLGSTVFVFVFMLGVLSVPLLLALRELNLDARIFSGFIIGTLSIAVVYFIGNVTNPYTNPNRHLLRDLLKFLFMFPLFLAMSMGLSFHNTIAVVQGYLGKRSAFVRTPKYAIRNLTDTIKSKKYLSHRFNWTTLWEGILCLYFGFAILLGLQIGDYSLIIFHILLVIGYGAIFYFSVKHLNYK